MRPEVDDPEAALYECYGCGRRRRTLDGRVCPACWAAMRNVARSRDL